MSLRLYRLFVIISISTFFGEGVQARRSTVAALQFPCESHLPESNFGTNLLHESIWTTTGTAHRSKHGVPGEIHYRHVTSPHRLFSIL